MYLYFKIVVITMYYNFLMSFQSARVNEKLITIYIIVGSLTYRKYGISSRTLIEAALY